MPIVSPCATSLTSKPGTRRAIWCRSAPWRRSQDTTGPFRVPHYNLYPAAELQLSLAHGFSSGEGIAAIETIAHERLPPGFGFEWTEIALQEKLAGNTAFIAFGLAVVFVFLLLAALYESWLLPLAVILIVPMCVLAAMIGVTYRGLGSQHTR